MEADRSDSSSVSEKDETVVEEDSNTSPRRNSTEETVEKDYPNHRNNKDPDESSDDEGEARVARSKKRVQRFTDSEEESEISNVQNIEVNEAPSNDHDSGDSSDTSIFKSVLQKSRIRKVSTSGSESELCTSKALKNEEQQTRMNNKRSKLTQKFKGLINSRKEEVENESRKMEKKNEERKSEDCNTSDEEATQIEKIRQKIKERTMTLKSTIYDSESSDEDRTPTKEIPIQKKGRKSTKLISPQPIRMSAKQAMENMHKIKSESNRMLREKDVSLPYHRPKALSLKDIMSRRRPAVSADGKALPIKMNEEQLKQYALSLEQRQKEMIELCKSDTDDEDSETKDEPDDIPSLNDTTYDELVETNVGESNKSVNENNIQNNVDNVDNLANNTSVLNTIKNNEDSSKTEDVVDNIDLKNNTSLENLDAKEVNTSAEMELVYNDSVEEPKTEDLVNTTDLKNNALEESHDDIALEGNKSAEMVLVYNNSVDDTKTENVVNAIDLKNDDLEENHDYNALEGNKSAEMELVYNDSVDETTTAEDITDKHSTIDKIASETLKSTEINQNVCTEPESQLISLRYDSEPVGDTEKDELEYIENIKILEHGTESEKRVSREVDATKDEISNFNDDFSDDDVNMMDIDALIENAEIIASQTNGDNISSPMLIRDPTQPLKTKPTLTGSPGMMIDLDSGNASKKLSGIELLKQRFIYFARIKTPEELEKAKEKRMKPGTQHMKLKQELGEMIAEQRSLEWAKRLEDEKQHKMELDAIRGETSECDEEDIDKIEAKLNENEEVVAQESSSESEEELEEEYDVKEKPRIRNPMIADEAEESDCDEVQGGEEIEGNDGDGDDEDEEESDEESSEESEDEQQSNVKKGRILKAFEDSDDEDIKPKSVEDSAVNKTNGEISNGGINLVVTKENNTDVAVIKDTQDDELQLAQIHKSLSEDLFTSQESCLVRTTDKTTNNINISSDDKELGTQTFSILDSSAKQDDVPDLPDKLTIVTETQPYDDGDLDAVVGMCSGSFSQNLVTPHFVSTQMSQSQAIGEDVLALCTGKFYDNQFVSQLDNNTFEDVDKNHDEIIKKISQDNADVSNTDNACTNTIQEDISKNAESLINKTESKQNDKDNLLQSMLDELNDPEFEKPKQYKYFVGNETLNKENKSDLANSQMKKKFTIDSDDETVELAGESEGKKKKFKKKKVEKRALQISDDEEEAESDHEEDEENTSEIEDDGGERLVEYDSEENEIVIQPQNPKKKRKIADFFEQEAELTSEDEWAGSGDEDEAGLDRMEREEGDDDTFHQGKLQRELGQIHMRDVLDQDKREVRLIQELLLEDGDLGDGHRQRKFRWRNADGDEETDGTYNELADTQEEEFESEEQWRKQRHERDMFLKQMQKEEDAEEPLNVSVTRTSIIKANLSSKSMSTLLMEVNASKTEQIDKIEKPAPEKKTAKDIPSPKKPFSILQQNYHGSLLTRGRGALARLAALATPLAGDDDTPKVGSIAPSSKRNFVFATLTPDAEKPKVTKRKADVNVGTPKLVKKMKTGETKKIKSSLLDHIKA